MSNDPTATSHRFYIIRVWEEQTAENEQKTRRFMLLTPATEERRSFTSYEELLVVLRCELDPHHRLNQP
ncbi:hypothetical protein KFU94_66885 [Chloroflexi bacterium TSY]|nr:hypothetical protein [Chloroflexi bacterium TSY]